MVGILLIIFIVVAILCYPVISTPINEETEDYIITNWWREHEGDYDFKFDENNQLINNGELARAWKDFQKDKKLKKYGYYINMTEI